MPAMTGFTLAAAASIAVGLSVGFATTVGVTLAVAEHAAPVRGRPALPIPLGPGQVQYGDRCFHGHCLP
ncbi:putative small secreted protein [Mycobacterium europaeum]|uniref:Putative small secreted protein n=2 Tax=Mycobacterium europaeum TaxID=761804 RepID=A0A0U1D7R3_9MYCO|nr:putative small secreted protein [Mycobacterium europaeum]